MQDIQNLQSLMAPGAYGSAIDAWPDDTFMIPNYGSEYSGVYTFHVPQAVTAPPPGSFGDTVAPNFPAPGYDVPYGMDNRRDPPYDTSFHGMGFGSDGR